MPLDDIDGAKALQLITSRYDQREWRKKIEKILSLPPAGLTDEVQKKIFSYLKIQLQAYKSRRADPPSWIVGGYATKEVIDRARLKPTDIDPSFTKDHVENLGVDPGEEVDKIWVDDMLVRWFLEPGEEEIVEEESSEKGEENPEEGEGSPTDSETPDS
jgi:hypothetical protein